MSEKPISHYISQTSSLKSHCFLGISLGGAKKDTTSMAVLEYYPKEKKIFLRHIYSRIQSKSLTSADKIIFDLFEGLLGKKKIESLYFNSPLSMPLCHTCKLSCPGYETCKEEHVLWKWKMYKKHKKKKSKIFSPYIDRCAEIYISHELDEKFDIASAFGSNRAPLMSRAHFLNRRLVGLNKREFLANVTLWYIGRSLKIPKFHLRSYKNAFEGDEVRTIILDKMSDKNLIFFYEQDRRLMEKNRSCFEAFLGAFTGVLDFVGQCEEPPQGFPQNEDWIHYPKKELDWNFLNIG